MSRLVSIIVPAFNEQDRVRKALQQIKALDLSHLELKKEIVVINDGSTDNTLKILKSTPGIKLISYPKNQGKGFALRKGLKEAKGDIIAVQDADLEYNPKEIKRLVKELLKGHPVVFGSRFLGTPKRMSPLFYFGNKALSFLTTLLFRKRVTDMETCQKVFKREALEGITLQANGFDIEAEITAKFLKKGLDIKELAISYTAREKAEKKISPLDGFKAAWMLLKVRFG